MQTKLGSKHLFYILCGIFVVIFFCQLIFSKTAYNIFFYSNTDTFMDFFNSIVTVANRHIYEVAIFIYPPFAALFLKVFENMLPDKLLASYPAMNPPDGHVVNATAAAVRETQAGLITVFIFLAIALMLIAYFLLKKKSGHINERCLFIFLTIFSSGMLFAVERGNTILYSLAFLLGFFAFKDSKKALLRELSLICLACSAGLKIYPALFGVLLIRERRWKESIRAVIYGFIVLFVPFLYYGGYNAISQLLYAQDINLQVTYSLGFGYKVDLTNLFRMLAYVFQFNFDIANKIGSIFSCLFLIASIPAVYFIKENWKAVAILGCMLILIPVSNQYYALIYMIPAILLFVDAKKHSKVDYFYAVLFALIYCPAYLGPLNYFDIGYPVYVLSVVQTLCCLLIYLVYITQGWINMVATVKARFADGKITCNESEGNV